MNFIRKVIMPKKLGLIDRDQIQREAIKMLKKNKYVFMEELGSGAFGDVIAVKPKKDDKVVAAKIMHKAFTSQGELYLWPCLKHPNVLPLMDIKHCKQADIFLMPYVADTLIYILHNPFFKNDSKFFDMTVDWMADIMNGLDYLHEYGVCHLDLKVDNILIDSEAKAVLCDFSALTESKRPTNKYVLPKYYCPPEVWSDTSGDRPKVDGKKFDIWSAGMVFFYCFSDRYIEHQLWSERNWMVDVYPLMFECLQQPLFSELMKKAYPYSNIGAKIHLQALNLLQGILRYDASERPDAKSVLHHPLLQKNSCYDKMLVPDVMWMKNQSVSAGQKSHPVAGSKHPPDDIPALRLKIRSIINKAIHLTNNLSLETEVKGIKSKIYTETFPPSSSPSEDVQNKRENLTESSPDVLQDRSKASMTESKKKKTSLLSRWCRKKLAKASRFFSRRSQQK